MVCCPHNVYIFPNLLVCNIKMFEYVLAKYIVLSQRGFDAGEHISLISVSQSYVISKQTVYDDICA